MSKRNNKLKKVEITKLHDLEGYYDTLLPQRIDDVGSKISWIDKRKRIGFSP